MRSPGTRDDAPHGPRPGQRSPRAQPRRAPPQLGNSLLGDWARPPPLRPPPGAMGLAPCRQSSLRGEQRTPGDIKVVVNECWQRYSSAILGLSRRYPSRSRARLPRRSLNRVVGSLGWGCVDGPTIADDFAGYTGTARRIEDPSPIRSARPWPWGSCSGTPSNAAGRAHRCLDGPAPPARRRSPRWIRIARDHVGQIDAIMPSRGRVSPPL